MGMMETNSLQSRSAECLEHLSTPALMAHIVGVKNWPRFNALYAETMGDSKPARTVVPVAELHYGYLVEVDAIAVRGECGHQPAI